MTRLNLEPLEDRTTPTVFEVTSTLDTATPGTLRQAILDANTNDGPDEIRFNIPGAGVQTIATTGLPAISEALTIDGLTQPGASPNARTIGSDAVLLIQLAGPGAGFPVDVIGLNIAAANCTVRGLVIGGFAYGVYVTAPGAVIQGNHIGTDAPGLVAAPNFTGIYLLGGAGSTIGGTAPAERNVISASTLNGITDAGGSAGTVIQGNYIGTDAAGLAPMGNGYSGIEMAGSSQGIVVGGPEVGAGNVISANAFAGVISSSSSSGHHAVRGNLIGTGADRETPMGNRHGVYIYGTDNNDIGGPNPGEPNLIAFNTQNGITIIEAVGGGGDGNNLDPNVILNNGVEGISLGAGANRNQAAPVLTSAVVQRSTVTITGSLQSLPSRTFRVEFFANTRLNASGNAEGERFLGFLMVTTDGSGLGTFTVTLGRVGLGDYITSTATSPTRDTSEFSTAIRAALPTPPKAPPALDNAAVFGNLLVLTGSSLPGGFAVVPVPQGSVALMADVDGDAVNDVVLFTPDLVAAVNGQTGQLLAVAADVNGDRFQDLQLFNADGTTTLVDGRTGIRVTG